MRQLLKKVRRNRDHERLPGAASESASPQPASIVSDPKRAGLAAAQARMLSASPSHSRVLDAAQP